MGNVSEWRLSGAFANCPAAPVEARCLALPFLVCIFPCPAARNAWLHHAEEGKLNFKVNFKIVKLYLLLYENLFHVRYGWKTGSP